MNLLGKRLKREIKSWLIQKNNAKLGLLTYSILTWKGKFNFIVRVNKESKDQINVKKLKEKGKILFTKQHHLKRSMIYSEIRW